MNKGIQEYWVGSPNTLPDYLKTMEKVSDSALELEIRSRSDNRDDSLFLLETEEGVATITIKGPLIAHSNEFTRWLGITSYPDIRNALIEAAQDSTVKEILLDIDSPGGTSKGIEDVSSLISRVNAEFKPVTAYSSGTMASAAYWIATAAGKIITSKMADVGSIGVIATHMERTKQLEDDGIKVTVFRAGEFKALGGPYEQLSDKAKQVIQERLDTLYTGFIEQVATGRSVSTKYVKQVMAEGKEFLGYEAKDLKMVDEIMSVDEATLSLRKSASKGSGKDVLLSTETAINKETEMAKRKVLDKQTVAVLAAGGTIPEEQATDKIEVTASTEPTEDVGAGSVSADDTIETTLEVVSEETGLTSYLKTELAAQQEKTTSLALENKELKSKLDGMSNTHTQLKTIAQDFTSTRLVALGRPMMDMSSMSDEVVIQQYNAVTTEFHKTFPVGGQCALASTKEPVAALSPNHSSAVKATRI